MRKTLKDFDTETQIWYFLTLEPSIKVGNKSLSNRRSSVPLPELAGQRIEPGLPEF